MAAAVVFDLDGTLLDTLEDLGGSVNAALEAAGHAPHPLAAYKLFVGDGIGRLVERAFPPGLRGDALEASVAAVRSEYSRRWKEKTRPYPGVAELFDALARRGVRSAIVSNKPQAFTLKTVEAFFSRWKFAAIVGAEPGKPLKPDPAGALAAARALGAAPTSILYVGDTGTDMRTAKAAGMRAVGALWGFRDKDELAANGAETLIASPAELLKLI